MSDINLKNLYYETDTGYIFNLKTGRILGSLNKRNGYIYINNILAHRLIFLLVEGVIPVNDVDHINGIRHDNRWCNLRKVTRQQNLFNRSGNKNRILPKNVYLHKSGRFRVKMKIDNRTHHFGYFDSLELASDMARKVQLEYHGDYARCV